MPIQYNGLLLRIIDVLNSESIEAYKVLIQTWVYTDFYQQKLDAGSAALSNCYESYCFLYSDQTDMLGHSHVLLPSPQYQSFSIGSYSSMFG